MKTAKMLTDDRIVELYWARSESAITETAAKYGGYCRSIAYNILFDAQDAEESVNDTYLDAWNAMPPHRPTALSTFLGKITRRISIDRWRRRHADKRGGGVMPAVLDELADCASPDDVESAIEQSEMARIITAFLDTLPTDERRVFLCRYWFMEPTAAIAKAFGYSESKTVSMLFRTRKKLREILEKEGYL
ncbi:MAG: sigma-70 family RNA polymerase sigma factor [Clostridia bacterium]|nr:sigma-70 family RNA polymerase sigma factor [Clostridia bacterium]